MDDGSGAEAEVVTVVDAVVPADREDELVEMFRRLVASPKPDGLLRSELLRGQEGQWRIQTTWRDRDAVMALRARGEPPAAAALLDAVGATHTHDVFAVVVGHTP
jgi:heme-degrading monooxygenase HmoA